MISPWEILTKIRKNKYNGHEPVTDVSVLNKLEYPETKEPQPFPTLPCVIYRNSDRHRIYRNIDVEKIPSDSIAWDYKGEYRHFLGLKKDGALYTIKPVDAESDQDTPQSLMVILSKMRILVIKSFPLGRDIAKIIKYGLLIGFTFAELVAIFFLMVSLTGNGVPVP